MAVMGQPIEQCRSHLFIAKDIGPFNKAQIGGDMMLFFKAVFSSI